MTRVGAWVRAQMLLGWGKGALREVRQNLSGPKLYSRYQVGFMEHDPAVPDDEPSFFVMLGFGPTWEDAVSHARREAQEWKENGWWPKHLRQ